MARYLVRGSTRRSATNTWQINWAEQGRKYQKLPVSWFRDSEPRTRDRIPTVQFTSAGIIRVDFTGRLLPEVEQSLTLTLNCYDRVVHLPGPYFSNNDWFRHTTSYRNGEYAWTVRRCNFDKFIENFPVTSGNPTLSSFHVDYPGLWYRVRDELTYSFDGVISEGDDWEAMRREMDIGMAGYMPDRNGSLVMLPGAPRAPVAHITTEDLQGDFEWYTRAASENIANRASMQLNSSDGNDMLREEIRPYQDRAFTDLDDGATIDTNFGNRPFLISRRAAYRLEAVLLKKSRGSAYGTLRLMPGENLRNWNIYGGDYITITNSHWNLNNALAFVTNASYNNDFSVELAVRLEPTSTYNDVIGVPHRPTRKIEYVSNTDPENPASSLGRQGTTSPRSLGGYGGRGSGLPPGEPTAGTPTGVPQRRGR